MRDHGSRSLGILPVVGSLIVLALLIIVALQVYGGGKDNAGPAVTAPIERASALQCRTQVRNVTTAIEFYAARHGYYPADLHDLENMADEMFYCPVTKTPYVYDPQTGQVRCPDHP
jgi:hypothetical protein